MDKNHLDHLNRLEASIQSLKYAVEKCQKGRIVLAYAYNDSFTRLGLNTETLAIVNEALLPVLEERLKGYQYAFDNYETLYLTKTPEKS